MSEEVWKPIPGYEGFYEVSDLGRVRSVDRVVRGRNRFGVFDKHLRGGEMSCPMDKRGYVIVNLFRGGKGKPFRVSRLVLMAFDRLPEPGEEACHNNHDPRDNRRENLHWGTRQENEYEKTAALRRPATTVDKLTAEDAAEIRRLYGEGVPRKEIGRMFNTHTSNVWLITKGRTWQAV